MSFRLNRRRDSTKQMNLIFYIPATACCSKCLSPSSSSSSSSLSDPSKNSKLGPITAVFIGAFVFILVIIYRIHRRSLCHALIVWAYSERCDTIQYAVFSEILLSNPLLHISFSDDPYENLSIEAYFIQSIYDLRC